MDGIASLRAVAQRYVMDTFGTIMEDTGYVKNDPIEQWHVAAWYDAARCQPTDDNTRRAYTALIDEVWAQYDALIKAGYRFEPFGDDVPDPYHNRSEEMIADVRENKHLWVYDGGADHPVMSRHANWVFRAVHDCFGHAAQGFSFGPRGEYNAAIEHGKMFSPEACGALFTETHGQNSWVNYGPYRDVPRNERPFATQKAVVMPRKFWPV